MPDGTPIDLVIQYQQQGLSNDQIVNYLLRAGYTHEQVLTAFNQATLKQQISPSKIETEDKLVRNEFKNDPNRNHLEELAEAIIDEKWEHLVENINRIVEWKEKTENRMTTIEAQFNSLKADFDKLHTSIIDRVTGYDKNIQDVGTEIKALEKVFQKVLPGFVENVGELSRITQNMKRMQ